MTKIKFFKLQKLLKKFLAPNFFYDNDNVYNLV